MAVTQDHRELAKVANDMALLVEVHGDPYWAEELIPPMGEDPDEIIECMTVDRGDGYDHKGPMLGFTLWREDTAYRIIISKLHPEEKGQKAT